MTIQEAIKSGKMFWRKKFGHQRAYNPGFSYYEFHVDELLADDWEIKREPREVDVFIKDGEIHHCFPADSIPSYFGCDKGLARYRFREVID